MSRASLARPAMSRLFDGCQAALVWLGALALVTGEAVIRGLALAAMAAIALAAALAALFPGLIGEHVARVPLPPSPPAKEPDDVL